MFIFPYLGNNHPNWQTHIFQRIETTNQLKSTVWFGIRCKSHAYNPHFENPHLNTPGSTPPILLELRSHSLGCLLVGCWICSSGLQLAIEAPRGLGFMKAGRNDDLATFMFHTPWVFVFDICNVWLPLFEAYTMRFSFSLVRSRYLAPCLRVLWA